MNEPWMYLVLLGAVIIVCGLLRPKAANNTLALRQEIEDTLEHYIEEVAEENEKLLIVVEHMKKEQGFRDEALRKRMDMLESSLHHLTEKQQLQNHHVEHRLTSMQQQSVQTASLSATHTELPLTSEEESKLPAEVEAGMSSKAADEAPSYLDQNEEPISIRKRYEPIFALLDEGYSSNDIASKLQLPHGEVEVIIQLGRQEEQRVQKS